MDPASILGIATSITALISTGQTIYGWVQSFKDATGNLRELRILLIEFNRLLANLQHDLDDENVRRRIPPEETNIIIGEAKETLRKLQAAIEGVWRNDGNDVRRIQWLLSEKKCQSLQQRLIRHRDSFQGIYNLVQCAQIESHRRLSENILQFMREMHAMMGGNRPILLQYSTEKLEGMDDEADIVITKATDVVVTKDDEEGAQVFPQEKPLDKSTTRSTSHIDELALTRSNFSSFPGTLSKQLSEYSSSCSCHRSSASVPAHLDPVRKSSSPRFTTQFLRRCSNPECPARRGPSRGFLVLSAKKFRQIIGISLKSRSFNSLIHIEYESVAQGGTETLIYTTATDIKKLRKLLESRLVRVRERNVDHWTLLHNAAYFGTAEQIRLLIRAGSDVDAAEIGTRKPVHLALTRAYDINATQADRDRLEAFPNWRSAKHDFDFNPIHIAVLEDYDFQDKKRPGLLELINFIDKANNATQGQKWSVWKKEYQKESPLFGEIIEAFREEEDRLRRRGLSAKPYLNMIDARDSRHGWTPLNWATQTGRLDKMDILIRRLANPFVVSSVRRNVLHQAAESKQPEVMKFLLDIPSDPIEGWYDINLQDVWGETPLHVAVYGKTPGSFKCAQLLLKRGARRDLPREEELLIPLHLACWTQEEELKLKFVDLLTSDKGPHINAQDSRGRTPIFSFLGDLECFQMLLNRGADINISDNDGMTLLHAASIENRVDTLKMLVDRTRHDLGVLIDNEGDNPLAKAIECKSLGCAKFLLDTGTIGDLNEKNGLTLVHRAIDMGNAEFLEDCFKHPTYLKGVKTLDGRTVIEYASQKGEFYGRIKELILEYESYGRRSSAKDEANHQQEADI